MSRAEPSPPDDVPDRFVVDFTGQTLLGQYRVERRLADGGMGSVYLAEDTNLGRRVVVKVPHARFLGEPGFRARFRREIEELVRLEHPHVVRILARGEQEGVPFFVLQYLGGGSLEDRLKGGVQTPEAALAWLGTIAETLDFVHDRGVVHRDVKPANILFDEAGHVFLSDFGVVKALGQEEGAELTVAGTGIGSPLYMAPEQGMGRSVSPASDQYALASALYESLAGEPPFGRGSVVELLVRKGREDAPPVRARAPAVPVTCDAALRRALAREPADRFPTCRAFADDFRRGLTPTVAPASPPRVPPLVLAALLLVLAAAGVLTRGFGLWRRDEQPAAPTSAPAESPSAARAQEPMILLRLHAAGAEPRRRLRWTLTPGTRQAWRTRTTHSQTVRLVQGEKTRDMDSSGADEQDVGVVVKEVDEEGRALLAWTFEPNRPLLENGATPESLAEEQKLADAMGTLTGTSRVTSAGVSFEAKLHSDRAVTPEALRYLAGVEETMRNMAMRLPDDPVGVGARWETTQIKELLGMRYQEVATYEIVGFEGERVRVRFAFKGEAPDQRLALPGLEVEEKARLLEFVFQGKGGALLDLARPVPLENTIAGDIVHVVEPQGEGGGRVEFRRTFDARTSER